MNRQDILFAWRRWIASVALASTLLMTGCATSSRRISWSPFGGDGSIVVDSMNSVKETTSRMAEFARLKKKEPVEDETDVAGHSEIDKLDLQDDVKTTQKRSIGKTFAAIVKKRPFSKEEVEPQDPFLAENNDLQEGESQLGELFGKSENRVVSSEKPVQEPLFEQGNPFANDNSNASQISRLREETQRDQETKLAQSIDVDREAFHRSQVKQLMSSARLLLNSSQRERALDVATQAREISDKHILFYGPNDDDPRALVRHIREEITSSQWSSTKTTPPAKEAEPVDPFLMDKEDSFTLDADKTTSNPFGDSKDKTPVKSFAPAIDMIIESRSVPSRNEAREEHRTEKIKLEKKIEEVDDSSVLTAPEISVSSSHQFQSEKPVEEQHAFTAEPQAELSSTPGVNPFEQVEDSEPTSSTGEAEMPILPVAANTEQPAQQQSLLAPPPPERLTDADFINENDEASGPSFLFSGDQIAANEQQAAHLNAITQSSLPPMPVADSNVPELDGSAFSSWLSPKMIGFAVVLLLLLGFVAFRKTTPSTKETT